jgi:hypothetical protein
VAPLEPWEKALIDLKDYPETVHGLIECTACHLGEGSDDKETAHTELIARPSENPEETCGSCHPYLTDSYETSLHSTQEGYWNIIEARGGHKDDESMQEMFGNHCSSCHTTCGDCHVSQPSSVGGGFIDGHNFNATPSLTRNCTACHGSRVGNEYLGKNEGAFGDVHFREARMTCVDCHTSSELHNNNFDVSMSDEQSQTDAAEGQLEAENIEQESGSANVENRYEAMRSIKCEDCHSTASTEYAEIEMHNQHDGQLSCEVCHSISYSSCDSCHVKLSDTSGNPMFSTGGTYLTFLIGKNPLQSFVRPYKYVPVRHIPIDPESYSFYGENLLPNFDSRPTWAYSTPHNIQRNTPQNESCNSCHGNADIFLTVDKVNPEEIDANQDVIILEVPAPIVELDN